MLIVKFKPAIIFCICILIGINDIKSQETISSKNTLPRNYLIKVKQFSEFIDRFNFQKDFLNQDIGPEFQSMISRKEYIRLLFDNQDKRLNPAAEDAAYKNLVNKFIHEIFLDSNFIDRYSEKIFAELTCQVRINGKNEELTLLLKQEVDNGLKWAIVSVNQNFAPDRKPENKSGENVSPENNNSLKNYIPPLSNETNFMDLKVLLGDYNNLKDLSSIDCVEERLQHFYSMILMGKLKYEHVKSIQYHILDLSGWVLVVSNFQRNTDNSGWLISNLIASYDLSSYFSKEYAYTIEKAFQKF